MKIENIKNKINNYNSIIAELEEFVKDCNYNSNYYYQQYLKQPYFIKDNANKKQYLYYEKLKEKTQNKINKLQEKIEKLKEKLK